VRILELDRAVLYFWADLVFLEAALLAREGTRHLAAPITAHLATFPQIFQTGLEGERQVLQAAALAAVADGDLDDVLRLAHSNALDEVTQDRKAPFFVLLFPEHIGNLVRHALAAQVAVVEGFIGRLASSLVPEAYRTRWQVRLNTALEAGKAALGVRRQAAFAQAETRLTVQGWKEEANALRRTVWADLLKLGANRRDGKEWSEQFFLRRTTKRKAEEGETEMDSDPKL
jgi:hypothetical protein